MTIKDKITTELKNRFLQEIRSTAETGNERGFLICRDKKDRLSATKTCEGKECTVNLSALRSQCIFKIQGEFHTHPHTKEVIQYAEEKLGMNISLEDAKKVIKDMAKNKKISLTEPSYGDILEAMVSRYTGDTLGTVCVGTDIEHDIAECWTTKNNITKNDFDIATAELFRGIDVNKSPLEWTRNLFDKEIIDLK